MPHRELVFRDILYGLGFHCHTGIGSRSRTVLLLVLVSSFACILVLIVLVYLYVLMISLYDRMIFCCDIFSSSSHPSIPAASRSFCGIFVRIFASLAS
jgi:hypothetical protein